MGEATNHVRRSRSIENDPYDCPFDDTGILKVDESLGWEILKEKTPLQTDFSPDFVALASSLIPIMYTAHGCGLAAPQVGLPLRFFVYDAGSGPTIVVNPVVVKQRGEQFSPTEGCLSLPGIKARIRRPNVISVQAQDVYGEPIFIRATELEARIICHELDHLDGILITDRAAPEDIKILALGEEDDDY